MEISVNEGLNLAAKLTDIRIDSDIKVPASKKRQRDKERRSRIAKAYTEPYEALYFRKPDIDIKVFDRLIRINGTAYTESRVKELTVMLRNRLRDR